MSALQARFNAQLQDLQAVKKSAQTAPSEPWTDDNVGKFLAGSGFPITFHDGANVQKTLEVFWAFYETGVLNGNSPFDIVAMACGLLTKDPTITGGVKTLNWVLTQTSANPFCALLVTKGTQDPGTSSSKRKVAAALIKTGKHTSDSSEEVGDENGLCDWARKIYQNWTGASFEEKDALTKVTGFLALVYARGLTKTVAQLKAGFTKDRLHKSLLNLCHLPSTVTYEEPAPNSIEMVQPAMDKSGLPPKYLLCCVLLAWMEATQDAALIDTTTQALLMASLLLRISGNGLGLPAYAEEVVKIIEPISIDEIARRSYMTATVTSWERLTEFHKNYLKDTKVKTALFARLLKDTYFAEMTNDVNYPLATIFAVFISRQQDDPDGGVWEAAWAQHRKASNSTYRHIGETIYQDIMDLALEQDALPDTKDVQHRTSARIKESTVTKRDQLRLLAKKK